MRKSRFGQQLWLLRLRLGQVRRYVKLAIRSLVEPLPAAAHERRGDSELPSRLEEYSAAAESHWQAIQASVGGRVAALEKPFASLRETPAMLYRLGLALEALDLGVGQTVLDFGAGSCWLTVVLNRLGCRTISLDVSPTALALGRVALAREVYARPELDPEFVFVV